MSIKHTKTITNSQDFSGKYPLFKERGETLACLLDRFRKIYNLKKDDKLTYAGRLDPMADGVVLILAGKARFEKDLLLNMDKTYEVEVLLGIGTDTLDSLGLINQSNIKSYKEKEIEEKIKNLKKITKLKYPMYSSVLVKGKALFSHARNGTKDIVIPYKNIKIYDIETLSIKNEKLENIVDEINTAILKVKGDFRQKEIIDNWNNFLLNNQNRLVQVISLRIKASSGTYMRSLAEKLGQELGTPAIAYKIRRVQIGDYK